MLAERGPADLPPAVQSQRPGDHAEKRRPEGLAEKHAENNRGRPRVAGRDPAPRAGHPGEIDDGRERATSPHNSLDDGEEKQFAPARDLRSSQILHSDDRLYDHDPSFHEGFGWRPCTSSRINFHIHGATPQRSFRRLHLRNVAGIPNHRSTQPISQMRAQNQTLHLFQAFSQLHGHLLHKKWLDPQKKLRVTRLRPRRPKTQVYLQLRNSAPDVRKLKSTCNPTRTFSRPATTDAANEFMPSSCS